jgi:hypothetical protein
MQFEGVIESISSSRITGWVRVVKGHEAQKEQIMLQLRFHTRGRFAPSTLSPRAGEALGFAFSLPPELGRIPWHSFLEDFIGVFAYLGSAESDPWQIPFYKSVLGAFDPENRTALLADRRREYSLGPKPGGRIAALTIVYNEHGILPRWAKYYASILGPENVFILDQGSNEPYNGLPVGVTVIRLPRESFDNWLIMRLVATFQRHLLESYDAVLYADSDEFLCISPQALEGRTTREFLLALPEPIGITRGYNLHHDILRESAIDANLPVLEQRKFLTREPAMDKPMISRIPLNWGPGFHAAREGGVVVPGMFMLHLRWYDLDAALAKGGRYRESKWDPYDVERNLASYQRASEDDIVKQFQKRSESFSKVVTERFDESAEVTVAAEWMQTLLQF